jgi:hypothetical protein
MDGAWIGSVDIAINKAFTARAFDLPTAELAAESKPGGQYYGIQESNKGRVMIFAGGIPLERDGTVVGAVGVSGGDGEQGHGGRRGRCRGLLSVGQAGGENARHHPGGETPHALPGFAAAEQHISDADGLQYPQSGDDLRGRPKSASASVAPAVLA